MAISLVPSIGVSGTWGLASPFAAKITVDGTYQCVAIRRLSEFRLLGVDPWTRFYEPEAIPNATYAADLAQGDVCIVTLQAPNGDLVFVPTTYITSYPNPNGFKYTPVTLAVNIGSIPDSLSLSALKTDMADLVKAYLGVESVDIESIKVGNSVLVNQNDHNSIEAARLSRKSANKTLTSQVASLTAQVQQLSTLNQQLEAWISAHPNTNTVGGVTP